MTLYSGNDHNKLALRRQQGLTENNLWISVSYNIGEGGGGFTNNIITYVNNTDNDSDNKNLKVDGGSNGDDN